MTKEAALNRRDFLKLGGASAASALLFASGCGPKTPAVSPRKPIPPSGSQPYLSIAHGADPAAITRAAVAALGGIERFVQKDQAVIIKPNICVDYHTPEYAVTTNPDVVAELVKLCLGAGAKSVRVMDMPFGGLPDSAYAISGIGEAVKSAGGEMVLMKPGKFTPFDIPDGKDLRSWNLYQDAMQADVLINVPIAKHHSLARLSLGGKNLLGLAANVNQIHQNLGQRVADITSALRPTLTVMDAYRILVAHGPTGGSLNDVKQTQQVIASHDMVAVDAYSATLFQLSGEEVPFVKACADLGLGTLDLKAIKVEEINA